MPAPTSMTTLRTRVGGLATSLVEAFAGAGCGRAATVGAMLVLTGTFSTPASRWADIPVDLETAASPATQDPVRAKVEGYLGAQRWGTADQRARVARAILEESRAAGLDPLLVMAVIQVESETHADAVSSRGARGLMQVRPPTLRFIADREGLGLPTGDSVLSDPALNVRLGIRYLHRLDNAFGSVAVALVAYNAGPHRISGLLRAGKPIPDSLRGYPHRVHRAYEHFISQLGEDTAIANLGFPLLPEVAQR
jgi:soluble lytic murein transglycosylase